MMVWGAHGNQTTFSNCGEVTQAVCLSFLTSQAGVTHAVVRPGVTLHILHLIHGE